MQTAGHGAALQLITGTTGRRHALLLLLFPSLFLRMFSFTLSLSPSQSRDLAAHPGKRSHLADNDAHQPVTQIRQVGMEGGACPSATASSFLICHTYHWETSRDLWEVRKQLPAVNRLLASLHHTLV